MQVYGDPLEHPQTEKYWGNVNPIGERSCYDEGKRAAECLTFDYQREHNTEASASSKLLSHAEVPTVHVSASHIACKSDLRHLCMT